MCGFTGLPRRGYKNEQRMCDAAEFSCNKKTASAAEMIVGVNKHGAWSQLMYVGQIRFEDASN